jgi:hypothetical protein
MPSIAEGFRHFWLRDIHLIPGVTSEEFSQWIVRGDFVIPQATGPTDFTIRTFTPAEAKKAIAHDCTRMASAAFETIHGITPVTGFPKSTAWILIRAYYAAFFAAHSLLRSVGTMCSQLGDPQITALDRIAVSFGILPGNGFDAGFYVSRYDAATNEVHFHKSAAARRGSHEIMWETFADKLREISTALIGLSPGFRPIGLHVMEIEDVLRQNGQTNGTWLSHVRNRANYRQEFGLWFPYSASQVTAERLSRILSKWTLPPERLFPIDRSSDVVVHISLCAIIVSICHAVATDIEAHGISRRCFHTYGGLALSRRANQRRS